MLTADWLIGYRKVTRSLCLRAAPNAVITALGLSKYKNKVYKPATPLAGRLFSSDGFNDCSVTLTSLFQLGFRSLREVLKEI